MGPSERLEPWDKIRLPTNVRPIHYEMLIRIYLDTLSFTGNSNISINVTRSTDKILFHANKINVTSVAVLDSSSKIFAIDRWFYTAKRQFYVVILSEEMNVGLYELRLEYVAYIETEELNGLYKSEYQNSAGETRYEAK